MRATPRLARVAVLAVTGAAALSLAACSSTSPPPSGTTSSSTVSSSPTTTTSGSPTSSTPGGEAEVNGLIASVANNSAQVTQHGGNATVNFGGSTKVTETSSAALNDVTQGSCVSIHATHDSRRSNPVTAASVRISPAVDGKCPQGKEPAPESTTTPPSSPTTTTPSPTTTTKPAKRSNIVGTVASVSGNTINVTITDAGGNTSQAAATVNDKTSYTKEAPANIQAITQGKCMTAKGTKDSGGALQATTIDLRQATNGKCGHDHDR